MGRTPAALFLTLLPFTAISCSSVSETGEQAVTAEAILAETLRECPELPGIEPETDAEGSPPEYPREASFGALECVGRWAVACHEIEAAGISRSDDETARGVCFMEDFFRYISSIAEMERECLRGDSVCRVHARSICEQAAALSETAQKTAESGTPVPEDIREDIELSERQFCSLAQAMESAMQ